MNIAEKLTIIAENEQKVYDKGKADGVQSEYDRFWDNYQNNGKLIDGRYAFNGSQWNNKTFNPKHTIYINYAIQTFENCGCTDCDLRKWRFNWDSCYNFQSAFKNFKGLVAVGEINCSGASNLDQMFYGCNLLKEIDELRVVASCTFGNNAFYNCTALTDISFDGTIGKNIRFADSPLNKTSIISIFEHLSSTITGQTLTLKKTAVNEAFGINVDDETTYPEGSEYYILRHSRDNWSVSYA